MALSARASGPDISAPVTSGGPPLTPEQLAALPHDDQGPHLVATVWTLLSVAALFLAARVYCKFSRHRGLWWDDWILIASWVCITSESAVMTYAVHVGYGKHIWDLPPDLAAAVQTVKAIDAAGTLSLVAAVWSKTSFALTLLRLVEGGWMRWVLYYIIISMNIAMGLSALFIFVQCTPVAKSWDFTLPGECWPVTVLINYDIFSASYSAVCDIALALLPWKLLWGLQMKKKEKIGVAVAMGCGIFAGITAIVKTAMINRMGAADPADGVVLFMWGNAETCVTIVAASIPVLRVLFREVSSSARRRYYITNDPTDSMQANSKRRTKLNTVTVTGGQRSRTLQTSSANTDGGKHPDDCSDKSILEGRRSQGRIVRTNEVNIEYHDRKDADSVEYEMDHLAPA